MNHTNNTLIPERLKSARERLNLSKAEAARRIGLTAASYVRYEADDATLHFEVVRADNRSRFAPYQGTCRETGS